MVTDHRMFTRAEDEMIVRQSRGELTIYDLRKYLRANMTSINRRASELGVKVLPRLPRLATGRPAGSFPSTHDDLTPARIRNDKLLKRLQEVHGK